MSKRQTRSLASWWNSQMVVLYTMPDTFAVDGLAAELEAFLPPAQQLTLHDQVAITVVNELGLWVTQQSFFMPLVQRIIDMLQQKE